jgi:hypothetical protein
MFSSIMSLLSRQYIETSNVRVKDAVDCFVFGRSLLQFSVHREDTATEIFGGILQTPSENEGIVSENHQSIVVA